MGTDRLDKRFLTHWLHNPAGPENGDPTLDAENRIEGLLCSFHACRDRYGDRYRKKLPGFLQKGVDGILDHLSRHRVDRCRAYRLVETGFCDATDTDTAVDSDEIFPGFHVALNRPFCFLPLSRIQLQIVF